MDPEATEALIAQYEADGDHEEAEYLRGELAAWKARGGF